MVKKRRQVEEDDDDVGTAGDGREDCTFLDHIYPANPTPETRCYCGKKVWKPFIKLDDFLIEGSIIRTIPGGPLYRVEMVNQSRARCRVTTAQREVDREKKFNAPVFAPIPGTPLTEEGEPIYDSDTEEAQGRLINISPRSVCIRVSLAELKTEIHGRSTVMATKQMASIPVAGKSNKDREAERRTKLATKPNGAARPLTGAAAKAKANARPAVQKTVRPCGCGCGGETMSHFIPGHDARYKGWMKKLADGRLDQAELKKLMGQKTFGKYTFKKKGTGFVPNETYQEAAGA